MYISHKYKFIYFAPTKVASNTIAIVLTDVYDAMVMKPQTSDPKYCWNHHSIFLPAEFQDYYLITSVRNPYIREVSKYNYLIEQGFLNGWEQEQLQWLGNNDGHLSFDNYVDWVCDKKFIGKWIRYDAWKYSLKQMIFEGPVFDGCVPIKKLDKVIKVEKLIEDFLSMPFVKKDGKTMSHLRTKYNFSTKLTQKEFPEHLRDKYYNAFKEDFEFFGYDKDIPKLDTAIAVQDKEQVYFNERKVNKSVYRKIL